MQASENKENFGARSEFLLSGLIAQEQSRDSFPKGAECSLPGGDSAFIFSHRRSVSAASRHALQPNDGNLMALRFPNRHNI